MSKRSKNFKVVPWKKYVLLLAIFPSSVYALYDAKQYHDADFFYFYNPLIISLVITLLIGYHFYNLKYYLDGKMLVVEGLVNRKVAIDKLKHILVRKESLEFVDGFSLFSIALRSEIQELDELTVLIDEVLIDHPGVKLKGAVEYREKWFPKTFAARKP